MPKTITLTILLVILCAGCAMNHHRFNNPDKWFLKDQLRVEGYGDEIKSVDEE